MLWVTKDQVRYTHRPLLRQVNQLNRATPSPWALALFKLLKQAHHLIRQITLLTGQLLALPLGVKVKQSAFIFAPLHLSVKAPAG